MAETQPKNENGDLVVSMTQRVRKDIFVSLSIDQKRDSSMGPCDSAITGAGVK